MADPQASGDLPRRGARGRRAAALIALVLGLAGFVISATGMATQLLPRRFSAAQQRQIESWEIAGRWQHLTAGQIFPATVSYQLSAEVLQDATPLNLNALRVAIAPRSGCGSGVTTAAAASVLRHDGCQAVLRATYADATGTYVMTVGVAVLPSAAAAVKADRSLAQPRLTANQSEGGPARPGSWSSGITAPRPRCTTTAGRSRPASPTARTWSCTPPGTRTAGRACRWPPITTPTRR